MLIFLFIELSWTALCREGSLLEFQIDLRYTKECGRVTPVKTKYIKELTEIRTSWVAFYCKSCLFMFQSSCEEGNNVNVFHLRSRKKLLDSFILESCNFGEEKYEIKCLSSSLTVKNRMFHHFKNKWRRETEKKYLFKIESLQIFGKNLLGSEFARKFRI